MYYTKLFGDFLTKNVLAISSQIPQFGLYGTEMQEMGRTMLHTVKLLRVLQLEVVLHVRFMVDAAEVVVPTPL